MLFSSVESFNIVEDKNCQADIKPVKNARTPEYWSDGVMVFKTQYSTIHSSRLLLRLMASGPGARVFFFQTGFNG
jgi:hypothetical protein